MIKPGTPDFQGEWARCQPGEPVPLGAIQAPDKFLSYVCMWPEKDYVLGRGSADLHRPGMDAWFPHGGEWSASRDNLRFTVLVDDGKVPGLYIWTKISQLAEFPEMKPVVVCGLSPVIVNDILGKGSVEHLSAWTSEGGREYNHDKETVLRSLILCQSQSRPEGENGWREIHIHEPNKITLNQVINERLETKTETLINDTDEPRQMQIQLKFKSEQGQSWKPQVTEECDLETVIKSESVVRKLAEADFTLGRVLYGTRLQAIRFADSEVTRTYLVPPKREMVVSLTANRQSFSLNCPAMEHIFTKDGKLIMKRLINGEWRAVTTDEIRTEIAERKYMPGKETGIQQS